MKKNYAYTVPEDHHSNWRQPRFMRQLVISFLLVFATGLFNTLLANGNLSNAAAAKTIVLNVYAEGQAFLDCSTTSVKLKSTVKVNGVVTEEGISYQWRKHGDNFANVISTEKELVVTEPWGYHLTVTNTNDCSYPDFCSASQSFYVEGINFPTGFAGQDKVLYPNTPTVELTGHARGDVTPSWVASDGGNIVSGANTLRPTVDAPGTYILTLTHASGCTMQDTVVVTASEPVLTARIWSDNKRGFDCGVKSVELRGYAELIGRTATEGFSYSWSGPNNFTSEAQTVSVPDPGTYTLTVTDIAAGETASASWTLAAPRLPEASAGPDKKLTCDNPTVKLEGTMTRGDHVVWFASNGGNIVSGGTTLTPIVDAPGTYTMRVSFALTSCTAEYTVKVTHENQLTVSATGGRLNPTTSTVQLTASSSAEGATYSWTGPNGFTSTEQNPIVKVAGDYTLTVTDPASGCTASTKAVVTAGEDVFVAKIDNQLPRFDCERTPITLYSYITLNGKEIEEDITYKWTGPDNYYSEAQHASITVAGSYTLEATHAATGLTSTASIVVNQYTIPEGSAGPDKKLTCANPTVMLEGSVINNSGTPTWHAGYEGGNIVSGHNTLNPVVDAPGTYYLVLYSGRCTTLYSVKVTRESDLTVSATGGKLDCTSAAVQLKAEANQEGVRYSWTGPNGFTSTEQNPTVKVAGDYKLTVTNPATGCTASTSVVVTPVSAELQVSNHLIDFNGQKRGLITSINTEAGPVVIMGRKRNANGSYASENHAAIFDTQDPTGDDTNLYTVNWGEALIINQYHNDLPDANQWGGELILDFSAIGPVTMESLRVVGMDLYEQKSWVYLYDANGKELHKEYIKPLGMNSKQTVNLGNVRGVVKLKVVLDGLNDMWQLSGSAAIDDIKFKVERTVENPCQAVAENITHAQAYPTAFSDQAKVEFIVRETENYSLNLYDAQGMLVARLKEGTARAGELTSVEVSGRNLKEGMYLARLVTGSGAKTFRLILKR